MKYARIIALWLLMPACAMAARHALLVGNSNGGSRYEYLRYVRSDIRAVQQVLTEFCGFSDDNIETLVNRGPGELDRKLASIKAKLGGDNEPAIFLFYYTGHAERGRLLMGDRAYSLNSFRKHFDGLQSKVRIAVFDACQSGSFTRSKGGRLAEPFLVKEEPSVEGNVILYSSSASENSQESDMYGNSVFTFHFVNALRGFGDASGDGKVTLDEAYQYSFGQTVASTAHSSGGVQHPGYKFDIRGEGNIVLADLTVRTSGMILESEVAGKITVLDRNRTLVAELKKKQGSRALIALNPGAYTVFNHGENSVARARMRVQRQQIATIRNADFERAKGFAVRPKGVEMSSGSISLKAGAGYRLLDLENVEEALNQEISGFSYFGMQPRVWLPDGAIISGLEAQITTKKGVILFAGYDYLKFGRERSFGGTRSNLFDGAQYSAGVCLTDTMKMLTIRFGGGYRLQKTLLKNLYIRAGLDFAGTGFKAGTKLTDSLFNIESESTIKEKGMNVLPHIGIGYTYRIWHALAIGADIRYRYQNKAGELQPVFTSDTEQYISPNGAISDMPELKFDLGGFDASLYMVAEFRFAK